jgi:hypothetical protein
MPNDALPSEQHPFARYIAARQKTNERFGVTAFCDLCDISRTSYHRILSGHDDVGNAIFEKIEDRTRGLISAQELYSAWLHAKRRRQAAEKAAAE